MRNLLLVDISATWVGITCVCTSLSLSCYLCSWEPMPVSHPGFYPPQVQYPQASHPGPKGPQYWICHTVTCSPPYFLNCVELYYHRWTYVYYNRAMKYIPDIIDLSAYTMRCWSQEGRKWPAGHVVWLVCCWRSRLCSSHFLPFTTSIRNSSLKLSNTPNQHAHKWIRLSLQTPPHWWLWCWQGNLLWLLRPPDAQVQLIWICTVLPAFAVRRRHLHRELH